VKFQTDKAFTKTPNPAPDTPTARKQAQDLMTAAENAPHHETTAPSSCCGGACAGQGDLTSDGIQLGTINVTVISSSPEEVAQQVADQLSWLTLRAGLDSFDPPVLTIDLPEGLPTGIEVTPLAFRVKRGDAIVNIGYTESFHDKIGWCANGFRHEARDANPETPPPFWNDMRQAVFGNPTDAIDAAVKWLDALDAWYEATEAAVSAMKVRLDNAIPGE